MKISMNAIIVIVVDTKSMPLYRPIARDIEVAPTIVSLAPTAEPNVAICNVVSCAASAIHLS